MTDELVEAILSEIYGTGKSVLNQQIPDSEETQCETDQC